MTIKLIAATVFTLIFLAINTEGQCGPALRADIPFDFVVNGREARAGEYLIERASCLTSMPTVVLRDSGGRSLGVINRFPVEIRGRKDAPSIVFEDYDGKRFLSEVHAVGGRYSFRTRQGKAETGLARTARPKRTYVQVRNN